MKFIRFNGQNIVFEAKNNEICFLSNAMNEVCNGIRLQDFENTVGTDIESACAILQSLNLIYKDGVN